MFESRFDLFAGFLAVFGVYRNPMFQQIKKQAIIEIKAFDLCTSSALNICTLWGFTLLLVRVFIANLLVFGFTECLNGELVSSADGLFCRLSLLMIESTFNPFHSVITLLMHTYPRIRVLVPASFQY